MPGPASPSTARPRPRSHARPGRRAVIAAVILAVLGTGSYVAWKQMFAAKSPRELYQIVPVTRGDLEDLVSATGTLQPRDYVDVGAQVSGQLKKIHVEIGSVVTERDLLAEIDPTVFLANVDARRAGLRNQKATKLDREAQLVLAELQFKRQEALRAEGATSADAYQQAEAALKSSRAQIAALQAQIEQTESTLRADEANLNYAKIYAPMSGTVVSITARQGQTLNSNQSAPIILRIADLSTMTVQTQVSEADVNKLRQGMDVYFTTLGSGGQRWWGTLRKIEPTPTVTNNVVLYNALFDVPNANRALMTSMTAQVFFVAMSVKDTLLLPVAAIQQGNRGLRAGREGMQQGPGAGRGAGADAPVSAGREARVVPDIERGERLPRRLTEGQTDRGADRASAGWVPGSRDRANARPSAPTTAGAPPAASTGQPAANADTLARRPPRDPRRATIQVLTPDGKIEERQIEVGVSNRVQVQVLSGLEEGEQVIAGVRQQATPARAASGNALPPGVMPSGMSAGAPRGR